MILVIVLFLNKTIAMIIIDDIIKNNKSVIY
jgi:hypothetical protein